MNWISVEDRLPHDDIVVMVYVPNASEPVWIGFYVSEDDDWFWAEGVMIFDTVTHWMPLPAPPNGVAT